MGVSSLLSVCRANLCPLEASCTLIEKTERFPAYTWIHSPALSYAEPCSTVLSPQLLLVLHRPRHGRSTGRAFPVDPVVRTLGSAVAAPVGVPTMEPRHTGEGCVAAPRSVGDK
ncbi:uncharacterized protein LOC117654308 isoform X7 [Thrips palmi]|uniref:Uncharacterized protein LOC117654308 isoform X7 n=1 Tax=Thrips palmi TaxID=161013 RepID=A0A6P9AEP3_THRPL|nr:uncharacterized protein LOC117654308 isoform X7 [Thrips palmi]